MAVSELTKPMQKVKYIVHGMTRDVVKAIFAVLDTAKNRFTGLDINDAQLWCAVSLNEVLSLKVKNVILDKVKYPYVVLCEKEGGLQSIYLHDDHVECSDSTL